MRPAWAEVDLGSIQRNVAAVRQRLTPGCRFLAVVKANGYGHGAVEAARAAIAGGAEWLGVILVSEARLLREAGIEAPILLLHEPPQADADEVIGLGLTPCVFSEQGIAALEAAAQRAGRTVHVHLKIDTGLNRYGAPFERLHDTVKLLAKSNHLDVEGVFSHLACADQPGHPFTDIQGRRFQEAIDRLGAHRIDPPLRHLANSAGAITRPEMQFDMVRVGIATYGLAPGPALRDAMTYEPALSLKALVTMAKRVRAGEGISYGRHHVLEKVSTIVTVPLGYADGWARAVSGRVCVLIGGQRFPVIGAVCMDSFMVDCGNADVEVGDEVVLIGRQEGQRVSADEIADATNTINYEVVTRISARIPRTHVLGAGPGLR